MPLTKKLAIRFLETQWSSINENKLKGIYAEVAFKQFLSEHNVHFTPGGWIIYPGKNTRIPIPTMNKVCLLPIEYNFSWNEGNIGTQNILNPAQISTYNYFRQVGVTTYFLFPNDIDENRFALPTRSTRNQKAEYPRPYEFLFNTISPDGNLVVIPFADVMMQFPRRQGNKGLRVNRQDRINPRNDPWTNSELVRRLFWFEYAKYYCQIEYLVSNNDLDLFIIGNSGFPYPVELKSKKPANDNSIGDWFGLDIGPFAKMAFFTSNNLNNDALYVVEEVDKDRNHLQWLGIKFTDLVRKCSWVGQAGGTGMTGGRSSTIKIPKLAFSILSDLLPQL